MTTAATFNTAYGIITQAYENAGLIGSGQTPSSEQLASGLNRLNAMCNHWQTHGLKLFLLQDITITPSTLTNYYPMGPGQSGKNMTKPTRVISGYFQDSTGNIITLTPVSWNEWIMLQRKTASPGQPVNYFVDKQETYLGVYLWPIPDTVSATGTVHLVVQTQVQNFVNLTDTSTFPIEWVQALAWGLAEQLSVGQPEAVMAWCARKAEEYRTDLENWDVEDAATFFTVDTRGGMYGGNFL